MATSTFTLNGVVLDPNTVWLEKYTSQAVVQSVKETLGGGLHIYSLPRGPGKKVTLQGGWAQLADVQALSAVSAIPGNVAILELNGVQQSVVFRHEEEPAFEAVPLIWRLTPDAEDWFVLSMKLMLI